MGRFEVAFVAQDHVDDGVGRTGLERWFSGDGGGGTRCGLSSLIGGAINGTRGAWVAPIGPCRASLSSGCRHTLYSEDSRRRDLFTKAVVKKKKKNLKICPLD